MKGEAGDQIVVEGEVRRTGEVLAVLETGGVTHYRVRWDDDGTEGLFFPGEEVTFVKPGRGRGMERRRT